MTLSDRGSPCPLSKKRTPPVLSPAPCEDMLPVLFPPEPSFDAVPLELRALRQWVCWRVEPRCGGKCAKVPVQPDGKAASVANARTWTDFETARTALATSSFDGLGFVFNANGLVGIDLDDVVRADGSFESWAQEIVGILDSYTEWSPSGRGLHVIAGGRAPKGGNRRGPIEVYDGGRFFTMTGWHVVGTPRRIEERSREIAAIHERYIVRPEQKRALSRVVRGPLADDETLLRRALNAKNGARFARLWHSDTSAYGGDHSRADAGLIAILAFWAHDDAARTTVSSAAAG